MTTRTYARQYAAAARITRETGVRVEYAPLLLGGTYVVDTTMGGQYAAEARRKARAIQREEQRLQESIE